MSAGFNSALKQMTVYCLNTESITHKRANDMINKEWKKQTLLAPVLQELIPGERKS